MTTPDGSSGSSTYWSRPQLVATLLDAVAASGLDLRTATPAELAPLDQFHGGGTDATRALAGQAEITSSLRVLDVGGGLGGPARMLAVEYGAHVTILDLTADYLRAGALLTARMGLTEQVRFCCGHALNLPFPDGCFDLVWTQNSGMQIAEKVRLYCEFFRVLRSGGRLAQLEPVAGPVQPPHFPLMWAREAADSHLLAADALHAVILATGFTARYWHPAATFRESAPSPEAAPHTIQSLVMGERLAAIQEARARNTAEDRLRTVLLVCERP
jgi:ubiquinone/menaquinone biosynthesis C-methylase UbiE